MGFDIYGVKPNNPKGIPQPAYLDWSTKPSKKETDRHYKALAYYEDNVKGSYFRATVWYWRPLWSYVSTSCTFLSQKDIEGGWSNSGYKISKTKAIKIGKLIEEHSISDVLYVYKKIYDDIGIENTINPEKGYHFDVGLIERFGVFCKNSGGFEIS